MLDDRWLVDESDRSIVNKELALVYFLVLVAHEQKSPSISVNITCCIPAEIECLQIGKIENVSVHFRIDGSYIQM